MISKRASLISESTSLAIAAKVLELKGKGVDVVGFVAGEPDFDTPQVACQAAFEAIQKGQTKYTANAGIPELRKEICHWLKRKLHIDYTPAEILVSTGAKQSLYNLILSLVDPGDEVLLPTPYWLSYPEQIQMAEGKTIYIPTLEKNEFKITPSDLRKALSSQSKLLILNAPSNPTGMIYTRKELLDLMDIIIQKNIFVISDEIYSELIYDDLPHISPASLLPELKKRVMVVHGVSKSYAMTGWRIGFCAGPREAIEAAGRIQSHSTSNATSISQYAALAALQKGDDEVVRMRDEFRKRRDYMWDRLTKMDLHLLKPQGAFYLFPDISSFFGSSFQGKKIHNSLSFCEALLEGCQVAILPGSAFGMDSHIRFSYSTSMKNIEKGMDRMEKFLKDLKQ